MAAPPGTDDRGGARAVTRSGTHRVLFAVVVVLWLVADQLTKTWAEDRLRVEDIDLVGSLRLHLAYNTGASFGLGGGYGTWISLLALVVVGILVWQGRSVSTRLGALALAMIVGGAIGNVLDRAFRGDDGFMSGAVVDFIDLQWWPVFNVADIGIVVGGLLLVASVFFAPEPDHDPDDEGGLDEPTPTVTTVGGDVDAATGDDGGAVTPGDEPPTGPRGG